MALARLATDARHEDRLFTLRDGRRLGYAEYGDPSGRPIFFFHGFGTSRVVCPSDDAAHELGVRLVAVDRP
ncbi:MAG: alpha/beta hydrolase, partial [Candidatus Limnocylindrales bacterium]